MFSTGKLGPKGYRQASGIASPPGAVLSAIHPGDVMFSLIPLVACTGAPPVFRGTQMSEFMPFDGERQAEYINEDADNVPWKLVVEKVEPTSMQDGVELVTMEWSRDDTGEVVGSVIWSSTEGDSVLIHGYAVGAESPTMFDTPIWFTDDDDLMKVGESVTTETNGYTFTSTFIEMTDCPVNWGLEWTGCVHMKLDDGDGDDNAGPIFAGEYWLVERYGPAWMLLTGYSDIWNLAHYDWEESG